MWNVNEYVVVSDNITGKKVVLEKKIKFLISGKIVDSNNRRVSGALIKIEKIDYSVYPYKVSVEGYVMSNVNGHYIALVDKQSRVDYRLTVYQPMIKAKCRY